MRNAGPKITKCNGRDVDALVAAIVDYNAGKVPFTQPTPFIRMNYQIKEKGMLIAGIKSVLYCWGCLYVDVLYVDPRHRNKGLGTRLLNKVEQEAKKHDCHLVHLDTFDFQAKGFYLKNGYSVFGTLSNCPKGHKRYYLKKEL